MKLSNSFTLFVGFIAPFALADPNIQNVVLPTEEKITLSFSDDSRRGLMFTTDVDTTISTTDTIIYDMNDITACNQLGGVCSSDYRCFSVSDSYYFSKSTTKEVCSVDVTFQSANCGLITNVPLTINGISIGQFENLDETCACGTCDINSVHSAKQAVLDSINFGTQNVLSWGVEGTASENYAKNLCLDKIIIDLHTVCDSGTKGDPHFKTWSGEHYEYHGQCDMVLTKDPGFADGLGLDVHVRTKLVRYWSYIKQAAIRIGDDILEVEGYAGPEGADETRYWVNFEYRGELNTIGGFPVTNRVQNKIKHHIEIDLSSKYHGQKIHITILKEFVRVDFEGHNEQSLGNSVGMLGDYKTGKTFARDGVTVLDDFSDLGKEWQVLPVDNMLFHDISDPQFPKKCIEPEDPNGERRRRLGESTITVEETEAACASLKDPLDRKDCVYDIIATQDLDMVGAF